MSSQPLASKPSVESDPPSAGMHTDFQLRASMANDDSSFVTLPARFSAAAACSFRQCPRRLQRHGTVGLVRL